MNFKDAWISTVFIGFLAFIRIRARVCNLDCGIGFKCVMKRSTCFYPPCPFFPTCVVDEDLMPEAELSISRPGHCPHLTASPGPCVEQCRNDGDCRTSEKCCFNGCGHICRRVRDVPAEKHGSCPLHHPGLSTYCQERCEIDMDCPGITKCCNTACGPVCLNPCYYWIRPMDRSGKKAAAWKLPFICRNY
ncbi:hypothetical protein CHS0354_017793 [Potamilus streckersoni]|uniref:WAP domain-containing protein n=2 Tax=Potamilus streckersoni TaxID=2493646 RepID=A0AAE0T9X9_9BIVA|nr:hypothetical protein CHS0354_017793 [Potamilus streckersoni]